MARGPDKSGLHGVYPEQYVEILRFAQNDRRRRVRNDSITVVGTDSICANYFCKFLKQLSLYS